MKKNKTKKSHSSSFGRLWSYLQAYRFPLYLAIFLKIVSVIMSVLEPVVIGLAITELTKNTLAIMKGVEGAHINVSYVGLVLVVYLLRGLIYELAAYYSNYFMTNAVQATVQDMRNEMTEKINRTSVSYFDKHQFGDLLGRFTSDVETVSNALQQSFLQVVNAVFTLALVIGTVLYLNLQLGTIVVITIPITFFGARYIMSKSQPYFKQQADALGTLNGFVQENLTGFNVLKLFGREDRSLDDFKEITEDLQKVGFKANFIWIRLRNKRICSGFSVRLRISCWQEILTINQNLVPSSRKLPQAIWIRPWVTRFWSLMALRVFLPRRRLWLPS